MKRSLGLQWLCIVAVVSAIAPWVGADDRPNFVIFVADDMAWDDCGAYGHPSIRTPAIDRLAAEGMRFDRAFLTCSSCSPSRCSMLTGRYPHSTGAGELHQPLPADQVLVSTPLREAGYFTAVAGKWHLGKSARSQFDLIRDGGGPGGEGHWVDVVKNRPQEKPFFFWFAAVDPHRAYQKGAADPPHSRDDVVVPPIFPDTPTVRDDLALYYDEINRFDAGIDAVVSELDRQGVLDETLILVITDNGRPFPRCKTRVNVDGVKTPFVVRYPKLIESGSVSKSLVSTLDISPTVLDLAGIDKPESFQGVSIAEVFERPETVVREFAFAEHNWHDYRSFERAIITTEHVLIRNWLPQLPGTPPADAVRSPTYREMIRLHESGDLDSEIAKIFETPRSEIELYAWNLDPNCLNNLAPDDNSVAIRDELLDELSKWQAEFNDKFPGEDALTADQFDRHTGERLTNKK